MLDDPTPQSQPPASAPAPNPVTEIPTGINFNTPVPGMPMTNPFMMEENNPEASSLGWEEWDQVMRDFQMDVENENGPDPAQGINVTEWFA
jgi:hypothetical protein